MKTYQTIRCVAVISWNDNSNSASGKASSHVDLIPTSTNKVPAVTWDHSGHDTLMPQWFQCVQSGYSLMHIILQTD